MSRLVRKNRTDIIYQNRGGILDAFDDALKGTWYINDSEYDYIAENATDEELDMIVGCETFSEKKKALIVVDSLLTKYYNK